MTAGNKKKKQSGGKGFFLFIFLIIVINAISTLDFSSLEQFNPSAFSQSLLSNENLIIVGLFAIAAILIICVLISTVKKSKAENETYDRVHPIKPSAGIGSGKNEHSHDRITGHFEPETGLEHWKIQLDGFLKAGLIDKAEYMVLLNKYKSEL